MNTVLIKNAKIVNEGRIFEGDVLIEGEFIKRNSRKVSVIKVPIVKLLMPKEII